MSFHDFEAIKKNVSLSQAASMLGLQLKQNGNQFRGPCPVCKTAGARALVVTDGKGFYCWGAKSGGDVLALVAHVQGVQIKDAAAWLGNKVGVDNTSTVPNEGTEGKTFGALDYLEPAHEAVVAVGFDVEFAAKHGIGYAGKGVARGNVLIPFRDESGKLLGYVGVQDCWLPADFTPNVVSIAGKKRA